MIIVTGGAGFIGSVLVKELNQRGYEDIIIVDRLGKAEKWKNLNGKKYLDFIQKDEFIDLVTARNFDGKNVETVFHIGACSSTTEIDADYLMYNNYAYSKTLAEWSIENDIRFIYASSAATYGAGEHTFSDSIKGISKLRPLNMYGYSKQAFDSWAALSGNIDKIVGFKFFNVYGPNEYHKGNMASVIYKAFHQILQGGHVKLFKSYKQEYGDGEQMRDFVYVKDVCDVLCWAADQSEINGIYNLGSGIARSWNDLAYATFTALKRKPEIRYFDMPENIARNYQYHTEACIDRLREAGYDKDFTSLEDGILDYVKNYLTRENPYC